MILKEHVEDLSDVARQSELAISPVAMQDDPASPADHRRMIRKGVT